MKLENPEEINQENMHGNSTQKITEAQDQTGDHVLPTQLTIYTQYLSMYVSQEEWVI